MEKKMFKDIPIGSYFKVEIDGNLKTYKKKSIDSALDMFGKKIVVIPLYEEVYVDKNPTFVLNY